MPDYFWKWYEEKGYDDLLDKESCFKNKPFLVGVCIEYLTERGQIVAKLHEFKSIEDMSNYLINGIVWTGNMFI